MRAPFQLTSVILLCGCLLTSCVAAPKPGRWQSLFDGHDTSAWRGYCQKEFPKSGWVVEDGCLHLLPSNSKGAELVTVETFDNFEFEWEWRLAPKANNGVKYFVTEARPDAPGHEYQMVDDTTETGLKHMTASFYDVLPPQVPTKVNPPPAWNQSRLLVQGQQVEHWLNGVKVLSYELGSAEVKAALARSKFKQAAGFGDKIKGHLLLTNHHGETWYRNLRLRELPAK